VSSVARVTGGAAAVTRAASVPDPLSSGGPPLGEAVIRSVRAEPPAAEPRAAEAPAGGRPATDVTPPPASAPEQAQEQAQQQAQEQAPNEEAPDEEAANEEAPEEAQRPRTEEGRPRRRLRGTGIRERRRQQTRTRIVDAAAELFAERGFDAVSVVEIAQRAGVVEKTVFNHFPVKEGLVFESDPPIRAALLDAVRRRPAGQSVTAAAGNFVVAAVSVLGSPEAAGPVAEMARVIRGSRTLQIREREILGDLTHALAEQITAETRPSPGAVEPWLAAHAVLGLYAALLEFARDRVLGDGGGPGLSADLRAQGERGLALLQFGLAGYAKRR
jgi:AcrR family transcriptional regulator